MIQRLALALPLLLACCGPAPTGTRVDPVLAALAPPDAVMLAGVRMDAVRPTALYQKLLAGKLLDQLDDFARETGFDPRRDVREILASSNGRDTIIAARGTFNVREPEGATKTSYKGYTLYVGERGVVGLIDGSTAVAGELAAVKAALDRYKAGDRSGPSELLARARQIPPENQVWAVSSGYSSALAGRIPESGNAANIGRMLQAVEKVTAGADLHAGFNAYAEGVCATDQDAKNLGDTVRGLAGLGRLSVPKNQPDLLRVWDGIKVEQAQRTIRVTVVVPEDLAEKLIDQIGSQRGTPRLPVRRETANR